MAFYRKDIDGLRAVAIVPVVLYHAGASGLSGGFVGVDVFFVISGYLITRIIADEIAAGRFSLLDFYERRARRILPALFAMMAAVMIAGWALLVPGDYIDLSESALATLLFSSNLWFWRALGDYFAAQADYAPLLHTWSLSVEEQFYIVFPLLLLALARWRIMSPTAAVAAACAVSFALAVAAQERAPTAAFYLPMTRAWEMGLGALLALSTPWSSAPRLAREAGGALGLALIAGAVLLYDKATPFPGVAALPPVLGAALVIWSGAAGDTRVSRLLSAGPLVAIGLISYALYLWHWPIMAYARIVLGAVDMPLLVAAGTIAASFVIATLSTLFIERPFRDRRRIPARRIFAFSGVGVATVAACAAFIVIDRGAPERIAPEHRAILAGVSDYSREAKACIGRAGVDGKAPCRIGADAAAAPGFALWGDSHAAALLPTFDAALNAGGEAGVFLGRYECAPLRGVTVATQYNPQECARFNKAALAYVREAGIGTVVLAARWALYAEGVRPAYGSRLNVLLADRNGVAETPADNFAIFERGMRGTVAALREAGVRVVVLGGTPEFGWNVPRRAYFEARWGVAPPSSAPSRETVADRNMRVDGLLAELAADGAVDVVAMADLVCRPDCGTMVDGAPLYSDDNHLAASTAASILSAPLAVALLTDGPVDGDAPTALATGAAPTSREIRAELDLRDPDLRDPDFRDPGRTLLASSSSSSGALSR